MEFKFKKKQNGFTLIELIIVISIMVLLFSMTTANYRDFQTRRTLDNARNQVKSDLRLVQEYSRAGRKPTTGCDVLHGYKLVFDNNTYTVEANCSDDDYPIAERNLGDLTISGDVVRFNVLGRGTDLGDGDTGEIIIENTDGEFRTIIIESSGNIE